VFNDNFMPTIGVDFKIRTIDVDGKTIKLQIWDTAGQERFKTITSSYYKGAHGIIVTYDITDRDSFAKVSEWMSEVDKHANENISRILVGNKKDLEDKRDVPYAEGKELADHFNVKFLETSAKESMNVEDAFTNITREIKSKVAHNPVKRANHEGTTKISKGSAKRIQNQKKGGCC
jgi:Ras-related protein Rab-1A